MADLDNIPPVVRILLDEQLPISPKPFEIKRFFRRLLPELQQQARWSVEQEVFGAEKNHRRGDFVVTASGALNPLSRHGICAAPSCRVAAVDHFARTLGLYVDIVTIPDLITLRLVQNGKFTNAALADLATDVVVLKRLDPLIRAGVVRFLPPFARLCEVHKNEFDDRVDSAASQLWPEIERELKFERRNDLLVTETGLLHSPPLRELMPLPEEAVRRLDSGAPVESIGRELFIKSLRRDLRATLLDMYSASRLEAAVFSGSRLDMLALTYLEKNTSRFQDLENWEAERSLELPWVAKLTPRQVVELRSEASLALPRLRERLLGFFAQRDEGNSARLIGELRNEASEVEAELRSVDAGRGARFRNLAGALGITISVYGFAAGFAPPMAALSGLATLLGLLHSSARKDEHDVTALQSKPGFALVKAREIRDHGTHDKRSPTIS